MHKNPLIFVTYIVPAHLFKRTPNCFTLFFPLCVPLWSTTSHCFCGVFPVSVCVCDELAGNWLLNGATAAMWDKIETRGTERPIHLLSANQPRKTTGPFIKLPLTTCRDTQTHSHVSITSEDIRLSYMSFLKTGCNWNQNHGLSLNLMLVSKMLLNLDLCPHSMSNKVHTVAHYINVIYWSDDEFLPNLRILV